MHIAQAACCRPASGRLDCTTSPQLFCKCTQLACKSDDQDKRIRQEQRKQLRHTALMMRMTMVAPKLQRMVWLQLLQQQLRRQQPTSAGATGIIAHGGRRWKAYNSCNTPASATTTAILPQCEIVVKIRPRCRCSSRNECKSHTEAVNLYYGKRSSRGNASYIIYSTQLRMCPCPCTRALLSSTSPTHTQARCHHHQST
jgi:hypothetical protein